MVLFKPIRTERKETLGFWVKSAGQLLVKRLPETRLMENKEVRQALKVADRRLHLVGVGSQPEKK